MVGTNNSLIPAARRARIEIVDTSDGHTEGVFAPSPGRDAEARRAARSLHLPYLGVCGSVSKLKDGGREHLPAHIFWRGHSNKGITARKALDRLNNGGVLTSCLYRFLQRDHVGGDREKLAQIMRWGIDNDAPSAGQAFEAHKYYIEDGNLKAAVVEAPPAQLKLTVVEAPPVVKAPPAVVANILHIGEIAMLKKRHKSEVDAAHRAGWDLCELFTDRSTMPYEEARKVERRIWARNSEG
jgi:hypothetical protein